MTGNSSGPAKVGKPSYAPNMGRGVRPDAAGTSIPLTARLRATGPLRPAEHGVDRKTSTPVRPRAAEVPQQLGVGAAGGFQGPGQFGQPVEGPLIVDGLGQGDDG